MIQNITEVSCQFKIAKFRGDTGGLYEVLLCVGYTPRIYCEMLVKVHAAVPVSQLFFCLAVIFRIATCDHL